MQRKIFYVTDDHDREFIFVGAEKQIEEIQCLCMAEYFCPNLIEMTDELGVFSIPILRGTFTPNEDGDYVREFDIPSWLDNNMPGFALEFIDEDGTPYFSTCNGLEIWYKENYDWFTEVLRLNEEIANLNARMLSSSKSDVKKCEYRLELVYKKLDDMDFDCLDVLETFSKPIERFRHVTSKFDMELALQEVYSGNR